MKEKNGKKKQKKKKIKWRNWLAIHAHFRRNGAMKDRKKEADKNKCRDKPKEDE